jgi:hypothetical protein
MPRLIRVTVTALLTAPASGCAGGLGTAIVYADGNATGFVLIWMLVATVATMLSLPALLLIAAPLTLPFFDLISRYPTPAALAFAALGAFVALPVAMIGGVASAGPLAPVIIGAMAGCLWVLILRDLPDTEEAK